MINDKSQGSVAPQLRCGGTFDYYFITHLMLSMTWSTTGKVIGKEVVCPAD